MSPDQQADLSTAQLAERTGMPAGTLRMWESRYGFPSPDRLPGGHRRYGERDVKLVREVLRLREQGLALTAAIARARDADRRPPNSIFSGLRERRPDLQPLALPKSTVLELTRAIEDEYCARATSGLLIASFQRAHFYRSAQRRWRELARTARLAIVLADFEAIRQPALAPVEIPVAREHPLTREWTLVVNAPPVGACLAASEQPVSIQLPDRTRRFEVLWSFEPEVVHVATTIAAELVRALAPAVAARLPAELGDAAPPSSPEMNFAAALAHRMIGYLGAREGEPGGARG